VVRSSLDTVEPTVKVGQVTEVNKDTFWPLVKAAGDKTVVVDMYTQW
jgi:thioredoxin 1